MSTLKKYCFFTFIATLLISGYPIYMGISVVYNMAVYGTVMKEDFPKYIIPYTPIAIAVIFAVIIMPLMLKFAKKLATPISTVLSLAVFFIAELLFESKIIVTSTTVTTLESWQMLMCYQNPELTATRTWTAVDILMGEFSPTFKIHFYMISVVLIITIINCIYGFAKTIQSSDKKRVKALAVQSATTAIFLGLCIFACFTAFYRDGELTVSALSAFLMGLFFITLGVTVGVYIASFLLKKRMLVSVTIPAISASIITLAMYIGESFLLSGHLYLLGSGFFFTPIYGIVLAPIDILIIITAGLVTAFICWLLNRNDIKNQATLLNTKTQKQ